ncbi:MAG: tRNA (adenosine(37)-N6)-dimethylallyltransferase MiaA [Elusimicrobiales bacterium]|nr:tRNA (adenosine(37)-N6)-dimethylallyltransferase MiaA [Elusimicrobiales bacterium]
MESKPDIKPIVIMGANASGKTSLAIEIAKRFNGEIISADSKQVYRHLSAGTSKPLGKWEKSGNKKFYMVHGIPYHLLDIIDPKESYDAAIFAKDAKKLIKDIKRRGKLPIIAGGTGMYIQALWNGLDKMPKADIEVRNKLTAYAGKFGKLALYEKLEKVDPVAAVKIPPNNIQRVIRALEVSEITGKPISALWTGKFFDTLPAHLANFTMIAWPKAELSQRIKNRTAEFFDSWVKETQMLITMGYPGDCPGLKSLGYPQILDYISGKISAQDAARKILKLSLAYAKRQNTWFRRYKNILKLELEKPSDYNMDIIIKAILK